MEKREITMASSGSLHSASRVFSDEGRSVAVGIGSWCLNRDANTGVYGVLLVSSR
ncbi:hypothetical protein IC575_028919 [Cucumis melo]